MRLKIFTWHIHGSYLYYLSQGNYDICIPVKQNKQEGYYGRGETFPFSENVIEVPAEEVKNMHFDCILFQSEHNYLVDQYEILSQQQRKLPRIYLEHNTPLPHACNTKHVVDDAEVTLVHVTHFNALMWNSNNTSSVVIEHGVNYAPVHYTGEIPKGIVIINNLPSRGRIAGFDLFEKIRKQVPVDLAGMGTQAYGIGEVLHPQLPAFLARYRFYLHITRWTSLGLSLLESMMAGMPVVATATTEIPMVIHHNVSGFYDSNMENLIKCMHRLIDDPGLAIQMGNESKKIAEARFNIHRFTKDWQTLFEMVTAGRAPAYIQAARQQPSSLTL